MSCIVRKKSTKNRTSDSNDIDVSNAVSFKTQLENCKKKLNSGTNAINLRCVGNSIQRGIHLALTLVTESNGTLTYTAKTATIKFFDEIHPTNALGEDNDIQIRRRLNSALYIRIFPQNV